MRKLFSLPETEVVKIIYPPSRTFNVNVSGIALGKSKHHKVFASLRGKKHVAIITSVGVGNRRTCHYINATGTYVPPMLVFLRIT